MRSPLINVLRLSAVLASIFPLTAFAQPCLSQPDLVRGWSSDLAITPLGHQQKVAVQKSYVLNHCLAEQAISFENNVVLLKDRSRAYIRDGKVEPTQFGDYWGSDVPKPEMSPLLDGRHAIDTAFLAPTNIWVGVWHRGAGSTFAVYDLSGPSSARPRSVFSVPARVSEVRVSPFLPDTPDALISYIATTSDGRRVAGVVYMRTDRMFD